MKRLSLLTPLLFGAVLAVAGNASAVGHCYPLTQVTNCSNCKYNCACNYNNWVVACRGSSTCLAIAQYEYNECIINCWVDWGNGDTCLLSPTICNTTNEGCETVALLPSDLLTAGRRDGFKVAVTWAM